MKNGFSGFTNSAVSDWESGMHANIREMKLKDIAIVEMH